MNSAIPLSTWLILIWLIGSVIIIAFTYYRYGKIAAQLAAAFLFKLFPDDCEVYSLLRSNDDNAVRHNDEFLIGLSF